MRWKLVKWLLSWICSSLKLCEHLIMLYFIHAYPAVYQSSSFSWFLQVLLVYVLSTPMTVTCWYYITTISNFYHCLPTYLNWMYTTCLGGIIDCDSLSFLCCINLLLVSLLCKCLVCNILLIVQLTRSIKHNMPMHVHVIDLKHSTCTSAVCSNAVHITVKILLTGLTIAVHIIVV